MHKRQHGFTLIELSIVLVIIGLLAAGILIGRDLIRASELRADIAATEKLGLAVSTFKGKYGCLPGDCANATEFFPQSANGNGNGRIVNTDLGSGNGTESAGLEHYGQEPAFLMDHLARAQLIENAPFDITLLDDAFSIGKGIYPLRSSAESGITLQCVYDDLSYSSVGCHYFMMGVARDVNTNIAALSTLKAPYDGKDARSIDLKIDDGKPLTGIVVGLTAQPYDDQLTIPAIPYGSMTEGRCALDPIGYYSDDTYYNNVSSKRLCALRIKATY